MIKELGRSAPVQAFVIGLFTGYLKLVYATLRWTREGQEKADALWPAPSAPDAGVILCIWHARIPLSPNAWPQRIATRPMRVLISQSSDGEFIARCMEKFGLPAIRGSSKKQSDPRKNKNGEVAFREMIAWVKGGGAMSVTPDGPRGPAEVMQPGAVALARITGAPVLLVGVAAKPCFRLGTWDRTVVPLPFGRAAMVWDQVQAGRSDDPDTLLTEWTSRLNAVTERAETLVAD